MFFFKLKIKGCLPSFSSTIFTTLKSSIILHYAYSYKKTQMKDKDLDKIINHRLKEPPFKTTNSLWEKFKRLLRHLWRFSQLWCIFLPSLLTLPLLFTPLKPIFLSIFVWSIEKSGVVFIKASQYLSHRKDIVGDDLAKKLQYLRQQNPTHSYKQTQKIIKRVYGKTISQMFDSFDKNPFASGSIGQVYRANLNGKDTVVKVRHPNIEENINIDLNLLFFFSDFLGKISLVFKIPVNDQSLKNNLFNQIYFTQQKQNLDKFNILFQDSKIVKFPKAFQQTTDQVLIQEFISGMPITAYIKDTYSNKYVDRSLNKVIARIGATTFFQMLMSHNFIHADCHGGNILVSIKDNHQNYLERVKNIVNGFINSVKSFIVGNLMIEKQLKDLYFETQQDLKKMSQLQDLLGRKVQVTLIDVGMVIQLSQKDKIYFINFIKEIILGSAEKSALMIYNISKYNNQLIASRQQQNGKIEYPQYLQDLRKMFLRVRGGLKVSQIEGLGLLVGMLEVIRSHWMKLDGQFATLLTNMLILEGIAKDLDPKINILRCAIPYFVNIQKSL